MRIYNDRIRSRYGTPLITRIAHYSDFVSRGIAKESGVVACLKIGHEVAAFLEGFMDNSSLLVPRLGINEKFQCYSPGVLLCNEIIKKGYESHGLSCLNLLRGTEKYKYDLGGKCYLTKNICIELG